MDSLGKGVGLRRAVEEALSTVQRRAPDATRLRWIKLDVVQSAPGLETVPASGSLAFDRSLEGLAFEAPSRIAFLPEELVVHRLANSKGKIRRQRMVRYL